MADHLRPMSVCYHYRPIPYRPLMERALGDDFVLDFLLHFPRIYPFIPPPPGKRALQEELDAITRAIVAERPAIEGCMVYLCCWDSIYWLLAPNRRAGADREPLGLAERAVFGAEHFPTRPGDAIRFVRPGDAAVLADYLDASIDGARSTFDAAAMERAGVYKAPRDESGRDPLIEDLGSLVHRLRGALKVATTTVH